MFTINKEWLDAHKTKSGGYTKEQMIALGIDWPPKSGWKGRIIGETVTKESANRFEAGSDQYANRVMSLFVVKVSLNHFNESELLELRSVIDGRLGLLNN